MLNQEQRAALQSFVEKSAPGTPFLRRAQILLLADDGVPAETIASEIELPVVRVRHLTRAFKREGLGLFPRTVLFPPAPFSADEPLAEAGRKIMVGLLAKILRYQEGLEGKVSVKAVHETRKATRRLRTALALFEPYFEAGVLKKYGKRFSKSMRRLAPARDIAVFLYKLDGYLTEERARLDPASVAGLEALGDYWREQLELADAKVRRAAAKGKFRKLVADFDRFLTGADEEDDAGGDGSSPVLTRYQAPVLIYERLAAVRAYERSLQDATLEELHALRIQCKELRYTLEFFAPILEVVSAHEAVETLKRLLLHLGDVNDARVALGLLGSMDEERLAAAAELYAERQRAELERLRSELLSLWHEFSQPAWRNKVATALAVL